MDENVIKIIIACCGVIIPVSVLLFNRILKQYDKQAEQIREDVKELFNRTEKNCRRIDIAETNIKNFRDRLDEKLEWMKKNGK